MSVSRFSFDELKNFAGSQYQQDTPVLDDEDTREAYIREFWTRRSICELIGNGSPNAGFTISGSVTDPDIAAGNIYVTGMKIELDPAVTEATQPNGTQTPPAGDGLWYLKVTRTLIGQAEDGDLIHPSFPAVESVKHWKADWTLLKVLGSTLPTPAANDVHIGLALEVSAAYTDVRNAGSIEAGSGTGFAGREGGGFAESTGHGHADEKIAVDSPDWSSTLLDGVLGEIDTRLDIIEGGGAPPDLHAGTHEDGGTDEIALGALDGSLSTGQHADQSADGSATHTAAQVDIAGSGVGGHTQLEQHAVDGAIHGAAITDHGALTGLGDDDHPQYMTPAEHDVEDHSGVMSSVNLTDIATRDHNDLQNVQGGSAGQRQHMTTVQHGAITGGPASDADAHHTHPDISPEIGDVGKMTAYGIMVDWDTTAHTTPNDFSGSVDMRTYISSVAGAAIHHPIVAGAAARSACMGNRVQVSGTGTIPMEIGRGPISGVARIYLNNVLAFTVTFDTSGNPVTVVPTGSHTAVSIKGGIWHRLNFAMAATGWKTIEIVMNTDGIGVFAFAVMNNWLNHVKISDYEPYIRF